MILRTFRKQRLHIELDLWYTYILTRIRALKLPSVSWRLRLFGKINDNSQSDHLKEPAALRGYPMFHVSLLKPVSSSPLCPLANPPSLGIHCLVTVGTCAGEVSIPGELGGLQSREALLVSSETVTGNSWTNPVWRLHETLDRGGVTSWFRLRCCFISIFTWTCLSSGASGSFMCSWDNFSSTLHDEFFQCTFSELFVKRFLRLTSSLFSCVQPLSSACQANNSLRTICASLCQQYLVTCCFPPACPLPSSPRFVNKSF